MPFGSRLTNSLRQIRSVSLSANDSITVVMLTRGRRQLHTIFELHFGEFCDVYDDRYASRTKGCWNRMHVAIGPMVVMQITAPRS